MCESDTLVLVTDLDEIVNEETLRRLKQTGLSEPHSLNLNLYYYNLNWKVCDWNQCYITPFNVLDNVFKGDMQTMRFKSVGQMKIIPNAGWHLSYFMPAEKIAYKLKSFSHTEYSGDSYTNLEHIKHCISTGKNLFDDKQFVQSTNRDPMPKNVTVLSEIYQGVK